MLLNSHKALSNQTIRLFLSMAILTFIFSSCKEEKVKEDSVIEITKPQDLKAELEKEFLEYLNSESPKVDEHPLICFPIYKNWYENKTSLWFNGSSLNLNGDSLLFLIHHINYYGLNPNNYYLNTIEKHIKSIITKNNQINVSALVQSDLLFTEAYFQIAAHLKKGRFYPDTVFKYPNYLHIGKGWDSLLFDNYKRDLIRASFDSLEPKHYQYQMLKKELAHILRSPQLYPYNAISFDNTKDSASFLNTLKENLIIQGFYDSLATGNDSVKLSKAIKKLQKLWYIEPDGKIGKFTRQALSYNREKIIQQISMSMERWRWEKESFPKQYAFINIPAFELTVYEADTVVMKSAVVCGKPETQTPILSSKIDHMLIYPYWKVPQSIATKEILPMVKRDTGYIRKKNFEVIGAGNKVLDYRKLPWKKYTEDYLPVMFRQRIGDDNSLGIVKFNFNNPYGVYLHDTNSKKYFKTSNRSQSHGCIRLENYIDFANFLIRDDSLHYRADSLTLYFSRQEQRKIKLKNRLPIYTRYYTAEADSMGLRLYIDIYRKDEELIKLIYQ